jgi:uncharacterized protein YbjT (DUF2867 family)
VRIAVAGARGFVGSRLVPCLVETGHHVVALGRDAAALPQGPGVTSLAVDVGDRAAVAEAVAGCQAAVYLVHSPAGGPDFAERDRALAESFGAGAAAAGVTRVVYLGGLGRGDLSEHLASRQEVGRVLARHVPVVELRAAVILGSGSISFEMLRHLTERLPVMVCPRWIRTRIQPMGARDLVAHLIRALDDDVPAGVFEVGGSEVTTYREMIDVYATERGLRRRRILDVPILTPSLSAHWVDVVTPVDRATSHSLIDSLGTEVVVTDAETTRAAFGLEVVGVAEAVRQALEEQYQELHTTLFDLPGGTQQGVYSMREHASVDPGDVEAVREGLRACGGDLGWYGLAWAWRLRILLGRPFGERLELHRPDRVERGARVDWWEVADLDDGTLVLRTDRWFCGEAWLGYRVSDGAEPTVTQVGALRSRGLLGVVYWRLVWPIHLVVFEVMAKRQATVKRDAATP